MMIALRQQSTLDQVLQMRAWGFWARANAVRLGYSHSLWQDDVTGDKWPESAPPAPIDDDYAQWVEGKLCQLRRMGHEPEVMVILQLYRGASSKSINDLSRILRRSRPRIAQERDFVLNTLYGALTERV